MNSATSERVEHGGTRRRVARLIEISNEMSLNAMDGQFARGDGGRPAGKIFYVFDESAFEAFIRPDEQRRKYAAYFHLRDWRDSALDDPESYWILINEMITIVAAEYMFSGDLPGQQDHEIFMTYWHRKELASSTLKIVSDYGEAVSDRPVAHQKQIREALSKLAYIGTDFEAHDYNHHDIRLLPDIESFLRLNGGDVGARQLEIARKIAQILAQYKFNFIDRQIDRIAYTLAGQIKTINSRFQLDEKERAAVETESRQWRIRLADAYKDRTGDERRSVVGLSRDALSVALVQHIASHRLAADERIVLVTGDRLLLETYWSWYSERYVEKPWEPNVLRSIGYFSPIMNFNSMDLDPDRARTPAPALFDLLQLALDLALAPFNLRARAPSSASGELRHVPNMYALRHRLLNDTVDPTMFPPERTDAGLRAANAAFLSVRDQCQEIERNAIWRGYANLERRASDFVRHATTDAKADSEDAVEYFQERMRELALATARISIPVVTMFIERDSKAARPSLRAPLALRLTLPTSSRIYERIDIVTALDEGKVNIAALESEPQLIFVIGSLLAIQLGKWGDAERYSEFARVASKYFVGSGPDRDPAEYQELMYLCAVCARLLIGSMRPKPRPGPDSPGEFRDIWLDKLRVAEHNLGDCEAFHREHGQWVREMRAISERASLRLFYAAWARTVPNGVYDYDSAKVMLRDGVVDLALAFDKLNAHAGDTLTLEQISVHQRVTRQIMVNIAAVDVLWGNADVPILDLTVFDDLLRRARPILDPWIESQDGARLPEVLYREIACFAERHGLARPAPARPSPRGPRLALDRALIDCLQPPGPGG